ncbi:MAG: ABC transporter ATP-binding protein [Clostridia bacterium]
MSILLETKGLEKKFGKTLALAGIDLQIESGKIVGLLGPNGSGKTTLIKLANGLLTPTKGEILVAGKQPGIESKRVVAYLPDKNYLNDWMKVADLVKFFADFYLDFQITAAEEMLDNLQIDKNSSLKALSKGTKEKVQLILVMSRKAELYLLDEPIAGVDPAARDYILNTILTNYNPEASVIISTHLIADVEQILDEVIFIKNGKITLHSTVDAIREEKNMSVDALFREEFKC